MEIILIIGFAALAWWWVKRQPKREREVPVGRPVDLSMLPERFVVYDLETTGLNPDRHHIIEIGAIRVNRDSDQHETFQTLVIPRGRIGKRITEITGITREMVKTDGVSLAEALKEFRSFVGDLPLVAFNAKFDDSFLAAACRATSSDRFANESCCALLMARRAWPGRSSYKLSELAKDGNLSAEGTHRALGDCRRTMIVYAAAARQLGTHR